MAKDFSKIINSNKNTGSIKKVAEGLLSQSTGNGRTTFKLRLTEEELQAWKQCAREQNMTTAALIRVAVNYYMKNVKI